MEWSGDDPPGYDVLDRAPIELPIGCPVLGDVGQLQLVRSAGGEVAGGEVIAHERARLLTVLGAILPERGPPAVVPVDPPRPALTHHLAGVFGLVDQEAVAELKGRRGGHWTTRSCGTPGRPRQW